MGEQQSWQQVSERLSTIERRLDALENRTTQAVYLPAPKKKQREVPGIRTTRLPAIWIGVFLLLFGWGLFPGGWNLFLGAGLILYGIVVSNTVKPVYQEEPVKKSQNKKQSMPGAAPIPVPQRSQSMETDIGKKVFSWLGIIALLIGVTFFVGYSFQNFGVGGKLFVGYFFALALLVIGRWMRGHVRGFSYVLEGGGWAALYFMTYALSFVRDVSVIKNELVTLILLLLLVVAMALVSLAEKNKTFTAGAFLLGYVTAAIGGQQENFTLWSVLFLALAVFAVSMRYRWYAFAIGGTIASYLAFFAWAMDLTKPLAAGVFLTGELFLILYGILFAIGHVVPRPQDDNEEMTIITGTVLNAGLSFAGALFLLDIANLDSWIAPLIYTGILGALYVVTLLQHHALKLQSTYLLMTIAALTAFLGMRFTESTLLILLTTEAGLMVAAGAVLRNTVLRVAGYAIALIASISILAQVAALSGNAGKETNELVAIFFGIAVWFIVTAFLRAVRDRIPQSEQWLAPAFGDAAVILLVLLAQVEVADNLISVVTGIGGTIVLILGFALANKHIRILGMAILLFTVFRVFVFDLAVLDAVGRMISFIVLGLVLLGSAYLYNRLREHDDLSGKRPS